MSQNTARAANEIHDINAANQTSEATQELETPKAETSLADALFDAGPELPNTAETIEEIRADIGDCTRCPLYTGRTQVVHSTGNLQADLMFVGEAPGADEDAQGFPFVGRAGQLLTQMIEGTAKKEGIELLRSLAAQTSDAQLKAAINQMLLTPNTPPPPENRNPGPP